MLIDLVSVVNFQTFKNLERLSPSLKMTVVQLQSEAPVKFTAVCLILFKNQINFLQVHSLSTCILCVKLLLFIKFWNWWHLKLNGLYWSYFCYINALNYSFCIPYYFKATLRHLSFPRWSVWKSQSVSENVPIYGAGTQPKVSKSNVWTLYLNLVGAKIISVWTYDFPFLKLLCNSLWSWVIEINFLNKTDVAWWINKRSALWDFDCGWISSLRNTAICS